MSDPSIRTRHGDVVTYTYLDGRGRADKVTLHEIVSDGHRERLMMTVTRHQARALAAAFAVGDSDRPEHEVDNPGGAA